MFDFGWAEMAVILLIALIVIGPKDLPKVARTVGQWMGKARAMAREFQRSLDDMAREAELDDIKKQIDKAGRMDVGKSIRDTVDPEGDLDKALDIEGGRKRPAARAGKAARKVGGGTPEPAAEPLSEPVAEPAAEPVSEPAPEAAGKGAADGRPAAEPARAERP
jgi:sec-independent protein translocase protein TatB